jgi:hypothetical protein
VTLTCSLCARPIRRGRLARFSGARSANRHAPGKCKPTESHAFAFVTRTPERPVITLARLVTRRDVA